ncbi:17406_t:CDS:2, partial [Gigaspora margarita]
MFFGKNKIIKKKTRKAIKRKKDGIPGLIDDVYARISFMQRQKRRNTSEELHIFIDNVIGDYEKWIEYLKNLNEFDAAVREDDLKQAFEAEKNEYDEKIKRLEDAITSLKDQLSANQDKIIELETEITKLTDNIEQMEIDNEGLNNQVNRMKIEIESKNMEIEKLGQDLYYAANRRYNELENKLSKEQEKSNRLNQKWEDVCFERNEERRSAANLRKKIIELENENRELRSKLLLCGSEQLSSLQVKYQKSVDNNLILSKNLELERTELEALRKENMFQKEYIKTKEKDIMKL